VSLRLLLRLVVRRLALVLLARPRLLRLVPLRLLVRLVVRRCLIRRVGTRRITPPWLVAAAQIFRSRWVSALLAACRKALRVPIAQGRTLPADYKALAKLV
jgi:hypothetical protein